MSHRFPRIVAAAVLSLLSTAQAFALTTSQIAFTPRYPQLQITCFTRIYFTSTAYSTQTRACDSGEKPGSVKAVYVG